MAITTRFSVAKTAKSYSPLGVAVVCGSKVSSETQNMIGAYYYGTGVGGDVNNGPAPNTTRLKPNTGACA